MPKKWKYAPSLDQASIQQLAGQLNLHPMVSALLLQRGVADAEQAGRFLKPWGNQLHDPMLMKGMHRAVVRLEQAIASKELICIYGDYDVDGTTSVAMLYEVLTYLGARVYFYIPDRDREGYGLSKRGVKQAVDREVGVLLCIDCGTKAVDLIMQAQNEGIDVIVCDHHEPGDVLPPAVAMLNPKQADCDYPFKELSACGIGYKLLQGFFLYQGWDVARLEACLDLVVMSIAADIVPITGENRLLAFQGLKRLNNAPRKGLSVLTKLVGRSRPLSIADIVFGLAPCINAAGRISHAQEAVRLLIAKDQGEALGCARVLYEQNAFRKKVDEQMKQEALAMIQKEGGACGNKNYTHVLYKEDWHKGVLGIVASRCVEHVYKPMILLTKDGEEATGSARSVVGYNLYGAMKMCAPLLTRYGGHAYAAGLRLPIGHLAAFKAEFERAVAMTMGEELRLPTQFVDLEVGFADLTEDLYDAIQELAPFGPGHRRPVWSTYPVVARRVWVYGNRHLKMHVQEVGSDQIWEAMGFNMAGYAEAIKDKRAFGIAYSLQRVSFQNSEGLQLMLKDIRFFA